jgi:hypothetical protein
VRFVGFSYHISIQYLFIYLFTYLLIYLFTYLLTYLLNYLLTYLLSRCWVYFVDGGHAWFRRLVAGLSPRRPESDLRPVQLEFVVDKVDNMVGFYTGTSVFAVSRSPLMLHTH